MQCSGSWASRSAVLSAGVVPYAPTTYLTLPPSPRKRTIWNTAQSPGTLASFSSSSRVSHALISSRSASVSSLFVLLSSVGVSSAVGVAVDQSTDTVFHMHSSSVVTFVGKTSITLSGPVLNGNSLLYGSVTRRSAAVVVIGGHSKYKYCPTSICFCALRIRLLWSPLYWRCAFSIYLSASCRFVDNLYSICACLSCGDVVTVGSGSNTI